MSQSKTRQRRKQPPANGKPEETAAELPMTVIPDSHTLSPFKAILQIVAVHRDEKGEILREATLDAFPLYKPQFGELDQLVERAWPEVEARYFSPNGSQG